MAYFYFETIRTYTASLLSLFGDLETQTTLSSGKTHTNRVPIQYSNREKSDIINQLDYEQIFSSNSQILPRAVLIFNALSPARERAKNKFVKIAKIPGFGNYHFNSIPFNFEYQIISQTRGMNEACQIIEQVCSYFNPSYNMKINEIPLFEMEQTSIKLELTNTTVEQQDIDDFSTNLVTITFDLTLSGNLYPAIKDQKLIQHIQTFLSSNTEPSRVSSISVTETETILNDYTCTIQDITAHDNKLKVHYTAKCEKLIKFNFEWWVNDIQLPQNTQEIEYILNDGDTVKVRGYTDLTSSDIFEKTFSISDVEYNLKITDIKWIPNELVENFGQYIDSTKTRYNGYLKAQVQDFYPLETKYEFTWWINGSKQTYTNKSIRHNLFLGANIKLPMNCVRVQAQSSDGRKSEIFEKWIN